MFPLVKGSALKEYFLSHAEVTDRIGFYRVTKPLKVFKVACEIPARTLDMRDVSIVNLIIPRGALIYAESSVWMDTINRGPCYRKMRASKAKVHSVVNIATKAPVSVAYALADHSFAYRPGYTVQPIVKFSKASETCASGIHFFLNVQDALNYR